jgi:hypothetical protein
MAILNTVLFKNETNVITFFEICIDKYYIILQFLDINNCNKKILK